MTGKKDRTRGSRAPVAERSNLVLDRLEEELVLFRGLAEMLPEAVLIHDKTGAVTFSNAALRSLCGGVAPALFSDLARQIGDGSFAPILADCAHRAEATEGIFLEEVRGGALRFTVSSRSMSERPTALRLWIFARSREAVEEQSERRHLEAVDVLATGIAHNFNNLLCGISGAIDVLEGIAGSDTRAQRCVGLTRRCVDDAISLTRKIVPSPTSGADRSVAVALEDVVRSVVDVQEVLQSGRVAFELAIPPDLPPIGMEWEALARVVQNLVLNGVEAIREVGRVRIAASMRPDARTVGVTIEDTGIGMDEKTLKRVYEPFFSTKNIDPTGKISLDGDGLGLWNVYRALRGVGGDITISSRPGAGTVVELTLPVKPK